MFCDHVHIHQTFPKQTLNKFGYLRLCFCRYPQDLKNRSGAVQDLGDIFDKQRQLTMLVGFIQYCLRIGTVKQADGFIIPSEGYIKEKRQNIPFVFESRIDGLSCHASFFSNRFHGCPGIASFEEQSPGRLGNLQLGLPRLHLTAGRIIFSFWGTFPCHYTLTLL